MKIKYGKLKYERKTFPINRKASVIPPHARKGERSKHFPIHEDEKIALRELVPTAIEFKKHYQRILKSMDVSEVFKSRMTAYIRQTHSVRKFKHFVITFFF